jgi:hypothetical protein
VEVRGAVGQEGDGEGEGERALGGRGERHPPRELAILRSSYCRKR